MIHQRTNWGSLTLLEEFHELVTRKSNGVTDIKPERFMLLKCECGKEFKILAADFPGRRRMRDCGCGIAYSPGGRITSCYLATDVEEAVAKIAESRGLSFSKAINLLCRRGLTVDPLPNVAPTSEESDV